MERKRANRPVLAVTMGDPAGVGPEICAKVLFRREIHEKASPVFYGSPRVLAEAADLLGIKVKAEGNCLVSEGVRIPVVATDEGLDLTVTPGLLTREGAVAMMEAVKRAVVDAREGRVKGVVTCPINKEGIRLAGLDYPGHTEFIRDLTGAERVVMMLAGEKLKVALVTIHLSLREAIERVTKEAVAETVRVVHRDFVEKFGIEKPRVAVAGLNPHAGEGGLFGSEEREIIAPAIEEVRGEGISASGPYPPDTVFYRAYRGEFDVVVAQYHDQG
ncbi:MAG: 4-hydroxythreonine-4-phosphate dehydrogenase PdxA, partial [Deltaproteobacteria bacterium]